MSLVFDNEFIRSQNETGCQDVSKNIIKEFYYPNSVIPDESAAQRLCENYCSRKKPCWGCILFCGGDCKYLAISGCDGEKNNNTQSLSTRSISQKPGTTKLNMYTYSYIYEIADLQPLMQRFHLKNSV